MKRILIILGLAVLHYATFLILFATRTSLLSAQPARGTETMVTSVLAIVTRILLFPIVEIVLYNFLEIPLLTVAIPFNSLLQATCVFFLFSFLKMRKRTKGN